MGTNRIKITDTTLRDAHQSLLATRMKLEHMLPIAEKMDRVGFHSVEVWGGATFDTCMRYLNEDPWERLDKLKEVFVKTPLQMLLRGQNILGYKHYADDVVEAFVKKAVEHGIDIIRIFDALNDLRNLEKSIAVAKECGAHVQGTISYTISPVHNIDYYVDRAQKLKSMGSDSICIKDMAGLLAPVPAQQLVLALKEKVGLPVQLHSHYTSGMAAMAYFKAAEAGVDVIDTCISSLALGTSQPATESMVAAMEGTEFAPELDLSLLTEIAQYFADVRKKYGAFDVSANIVDTNVLQYQIPGGMISNFMSQLAQQNALDKLAAVLSEVPKVRKDLGYPPLVTPTSQIVGTQAVLNVLAGERYKMISSETKNYVRGFYGQPPAPIDEEIKKLIIGDEEPITVRPADLIEPQLPQAKAEIAPYMEKEEDVLSYALFPAVAKKFLEERLAGKVKVDFQIAAEGPKSGTVPYHPI
ncbi:MAG: oxaloacetate decarboxylase subunit alpha [Clostridia bacterium]|jgi:oxaloacetate decarboxylase alpha subunit|nr:oxaloacetate decarboxylase subunit alpha [Clostridia bacterium]